MINKSFDPEYSAMKTEIERLRADLSRQYELNTQLVNENERLQVSNEALGKLTVEMQKQAAALEKAREALEYYVYKLTPQGKGGNAREALAAIEELKK